MTNLIISENISYQDGLIGVEVIPVVTELNPVWFVLTSDQVDGKNKFNGLHVATWSGSEFTIKKAAEMADLETQSRLNNNPDHQVLAFLLTAMPQTEAQVRNFIATLDYIVIDLID